MKPTLAALRSRLIIVDHETFECQDWRETFFATLRSHSEGRISSEVRFRYPRPLARGSGFYEFDVHTGERSGVVERCRKEAEGCDHITALMMAYEPAALYAGDFCMP